VEFPVPFRTEQPVQAAVIRIPFEEMVNQGLLNRRHDMQIPVLNPPLHIVQHPQEKPQILRTATIPVTSSGQTIRHPVNRFLHLVSDLFHQGDIPLIVVQQVQGKEYVLPSLSIFGHLLIVSL